MPPAAPPESGITSPVDTPPASHVPPVTPDPGVTPPEPGAVDPPPKKLRFKTHELAEEGYVNVFGRATRAEQRAAEAEKRAKAAEEKLAAIDQDKRQAALDAQAREQKDVFATQQFEEVNRQLDALNPDDPEYSKKSAEIWASAHRSIEEFKPTIDESKLPKPLSGVVPPAPETGATTAPSEPDVTEAPPPAVEGDTITHIQTRINAIIEEQNPGFDADDPAFITFCRQPVEADDQGNYPPLDDQIRQAVEKTMAYHDQQRKRALQDTQQPIPRSGPGQGPGGQQASSEKHATFNDIVDKAASSRVIK